MNTQINQGFLFPTQYWTIEFQENIMELQKESYFIKENDNVGVKKSNTGINGISLERYKNIRQCSLSK